MMPFRLPELGTVHSPRASLVTFRACSSGGGWLMFSQDEIKFKYIMGRPQKQWCVLSACYQEGHDMDLIY